MQPSQGDPALRGELYRSEHWESLYHASDTAPVDDLCLAIAESIDT